MYTANKASERGVALCVYSCTRERMLCVRQNLFDHRGEKALRRTCSPRRMIFCAEGGLIENQRRP